MLKRISWHLKELRSLGFDGWRLMRRTRPLFYSLPKGTLVETPLDGLFARAKTSDLDVFYQIFITREYRCLDHVEDAKLIIDCGANVGYSAGYFLNRFPNADLIAVEPDPGNFGLLRKNLAKYHGRTTLVNSGVWSRPAGLVFGEGLGGEWGVTVREAQPHETPEMNAVDIGTLLAESGHDRISILKVDIEGSEKFVFADNFEWLTKVDHLVIEIHGPECSLVVRDAVTPLAPQVSRCEELMVYQFPSSGRATFDTRR